MTQLVIATGNRDKMREIREIFADLPLSIVSMKEIGIVSDPEETGTTFEENSLIKARAEADALAAAGEKGFLVLADDSGLEIDALDKAPGVLSARFMGHDTSYDIKNAALLEKLSGVPEEKRTARFVCAISCILPDGSELVKRGTMEGKIGHAVSGDNGFGYDPIFIPEGFQVSSAALSPEEKNAISHRGKALRAMYTALADCLENERLEK